MRCLAGGRLVRDSDEGAIEIERKGATYYAVGLSVSYIIESILRDQRSVLPVSSLMQGQYGLEDVCLSLPTILGQQGIVQVLDLPLDGEELAGLRASAEVLQGVARSVGL